MNVLVDSSGKTLYSPTIEKNGRIMCTGACVSFWHPIGASSAQAASASSDLGLKLSAVMRPDGSKQLALDGRPLYSFTQEGAGQLKGNGFVDSFNGTQFKWQAIAANGGSATGSTGSNAPSNSNSYSY